MRWSFCCRVKRMRKRKRISEFSSVFSSECICDQQVTSVFGREQRWYAGVVQVRCRREMSSVKSYSVRKVGR